MDRTCKQCEQTKPIGAFYKNAPSAGGHLQRCIECVTAAWREKRQADPSVRERERQYWAANPGLKREKDARYKAKNRERLARKERERVGADPERARDAQRQSYAKHRESRIAKQREYAAANKEAEAARARDYYVRNRDRIKARVKARYDADPEAAAVYHRHRKVKRAYRGPLPLVFHTEAEWTAKLAEFDGKCAHCGTTKSITRDHIIPLSKGGLDLIENVQPLCQSCNSKKGTKLT